MQPIAYFSAEYALREGAPLYAGGLGVLAADYLYEMADQKFPFVAFGLCYKNAYQKKLNQDWKKEFGLEIVMDKNGAPLRIAIPIEGKTIFLGASRYKMGEGFLYLLDTDLPENKPEDRIITDTLYDENRDMRLKQEIILGVGSMELTLALAITPRLYHLNEGHSALLALALAATEMKQSGANFKTAVAMIKERVVFTNHTLVAAGNELFAVDALTRILSDYCKSVNVAVEELVALGAIADHSLFSMTLAALAMSSQSNAVSKLHALKATEEWHKGALVTVTNGIYLKRWDKLQTSKENEIAEKHRERKNLLLKKIKEETGKEFSPDVLLVAWARRLVPYKQPLALFSDVARLRDIARREGKELRIVFAGVPTRDSGSHNEFQIALTRLADTELVDIMAFLPNYDLELAELMVSGADIWLNTPIVGSEACGTSGMKAALNGVLPLSTKDGWVYEANLEEIGWIVSDQDLGDKLLSTIENEIIPLYYCDKAKWQERMLRARALIETEFSASRMLNDYKEKMYKNL